MNFRRVTPAAGVAAVLGLLLGLAGLSTLVGAPWQYNQGGAALMAVRALGSLLAVGVGVAIAWLALVE